MKFDKNEFLRTELGREMCDCARAWDVAARRYNDPSIEPEDLDEALDNATWCRAKWEVFQMVLRQFYGVEYHFTRTDTYYGIVTEDDTDWLYRRER